MATPSVGLATYRWNNNLKSLLILAVYPFIVAASAWGVLFVIAPLLYGVPIPPQATSQAQGTAAFFASASPVYSRFATGMMAQWWPSIFGGVGVWFGAAYLFQTKMVRGMAHSHPVTRKDEPQLYNLLENLCIARGIPMPRLEIIETHARNAFASGVDKRSYTVTVTRGLLQSLTKDEVEAVLAHELTHIMRRDVRLLIVTIIFAGLFGFLAQLAWSFFRSSGRSTRRDNGGSAALIFLAAALVLYIGYFATVWSRFALSRRREYDADAGAVELTKKPEAMINALRRIAGRDALPEASADLRLMCIENRTPFWGLFSTHPPIEARIAAIASYSGIENPQTASLPPAGNEASLNKPSLAPNGQPWRTSAHLGKNANTPTPKNPWWRS